MSSNRRMRSTPTASSSPLSHNPISSPVSFTSSSPSPSSPTTIRIVQPGSKLPGLTPAEHTLLRKKQRQLSSTASSTLHTLPPSPHILNALQATLIFAQRDAGTAVCIDPAGWLLTCAHCLGDTEEERLANPTQMASLPHGPRSPSRMPRMGSQARPSPPKSRHRRIKPGQEPGPPHLPLRAPVISRPLVRNANPMHRPARRTAYNLIEVSSGVLRGMAPGADPHDNSEIGTLKHDAWTYWGHSGAPLLRAVDGTLVGLHSSWDERTGMRRGIPRVAIEGFLAFGLSGVVDAAAATEADSAEEMESRDGRLEGKDGESALNDVAELRGNARSSVVVVDD